MAVRSRTRRLRRSSLRLGRDCLSRISGGGPRTSWSTILTVYQILSTISSSARSVCSDLREWVQDTPVRTARQPRNKRGFRREDGAWPKAHQHRPLGGCLLSVSGTAALQTKNGGPPVPTFITYGTPSGIRTVPGERRDRARRAAGHEATILSRLTRHRSTGPRKKTGSASNVHASAVVEWNVRHLKKRRRNGSVQPVNLQRMQATRPTADMGRNCRAGGPSCRVQAAVFPWPHS